MDSMNGPGPAQPPDAHLDLTGEVCPMTYVRVRIALDGLAPGCALRVRLAGEAETQVPRTAAAQGFSVSWVTEEGGGRWCRIGRAG